jgi:hypothetical protein
MKSILGAMGGAYWPRNEKIAPKNGFIAPRNEKNKADEIDSGGNGGYLLAQKRKQQGR